VTEERCDWCVESSITLLRRCWHQHRCRVCRSVLTKYRCLVSLILRPGLRNEIITAVNMKITVVWNVAPCGLVYIYCIWGKVLHSASKLCYLCPSVCLQIQRKITKIIDIFKPLKLKTELHEVQKLRPHFTEAHFISATKTSSLD
jgi:hypothetical protein